MRAACGVALALLHCVEFVGHVAAAVVSLDAPFGGEHPHEPLLPQFRQPLTAATLPRRPFVLNRVDGVVQFGTDRLRLRNRGGHCWSSLRGQRFAKTMPDWKYRCG